MRHILVDYARARRARKRGGPQSPVTLDENLVFSKPISVDVIALHHALERLSKLDEIQSRLLELHFFGGLTFQEAAVALNTPLRTLERDWQMARAWLRSELSRKADDPG
jgi:RNA polymerase sigma factor (TIGR02999 family)